MKYTWTTLWIILFASVEFGCQKEKKADQPHTVDDWKSEFIGTPMEDYSVQTITINPEDDNLWFVTSMRGLYLTRNGGSSWENPFTTYPSALEIDPNDPSRIFVGSRNEMYLSIDNGHNWTLINSFPAHIASILVSKIDNSVYAGLAWGDSVTANGIFKSNDLGKTWTQYLYNVEEKGLIPWDIEEDPVNQKLYVATEIYNHPQPYHPPFLRSSDGGSTWEDISGSLPWHAIKIQVHPLTHDVYVLTEGAGLFSSSDFGDHWQYLGNQFWLTFIIDKNYPQRFWGGNHTYSESSGGVYLSKDVGENFKFMGLDGHIVGSLCLNGSSTSLYVASYESGIYVFK
jgi:photosystem II stability/assembly factor-like uncharacterized protein